MNFRSTLAGRRTSSAALPETNSSHLSTTGSMTSTALVRHPQIEATQSVVLNYEFLAIRQNFTRVVFFCKGIICRPSGACISVRASFQSPGLIFFLTRHGLRRSEVQQSQRRVHRRASSPSHCVHREVGPEFGQRVGETGVLGRASRDSLAERCTMLHRFLGCREDCS